MKKISKTFIVKTWDELTDKEKEIQKRKYQDFICESWGDVLYDDYKYNLDELKKQLKYIDFDFVYVNENSQGFWIDSIKNLTCTIYGKNKNIYNINVHIAKYINEISLVEVDNGEYYYLDELKQKPGYKQLAKKLENDFEIFKNGVNEIVETYFDQLYYITDDFIDQYFEDMEFEFEDQ